MAVKKNGKWGYINKAGKMMIAAKYDDAASFSDGMAKIIIDKKAGYVNKTGVVVIKPQYKFAGDFGEGLAAVSIDGEAYSAGSNVAMNANFGYIDKKGKLVIPYQFSMAYAFDKRGYSWVQKDGREYKIDRTGKEIK